MTSFARHGIDHLSVSSVGLFAAGDMVVHIPTGKVGLLMGIAPIGWRRARVMFVSNRRWIACGLGKLRQATMEETVSVVIRPRDNA